MGQQMQWPSAMLTLVMGLVQSSWMTLTVVAVKVTLLAAHFNLYSAVQEATPMMLE